MTEKEIRIDNHPSESSSAPDPSEELEQENTGRKKRLSPLRKLKEENDELIKQNEMLTSELAELKDRNLRLLAEFENFRRRKTQESAQISDLVKKEIILKLLPVLDDSDRLFKHQNSNGANIIDGVRLINDKFRSILENMGLKTMNPVGNPFDPELCEALLMVENPQFESGAVVDIIENGYLINDSILRHAKVIVNK